MTSNQTSGDSVVGCAYTITRRLTFCAGHRVHGHETKCRHPHGHNYVVLLTVKPRTTLDVLGRVVDFSVLKSKLGTWLDQNWDHAFIYFEQDLEMLEIYTQRPQWKNYALPLNPTAENMAAYLLETICPMLFAGDAIVVTSVVVHETENCYAEVSI